MNIFTSRSFTVVISDDHKSSATSLIWDYTYINIIATGLFKWSSASDWGFTQRSSILMLIPLTLQPFAKNGPLAAVWQCIKMATWYFTCLDDWICPRNVTIQAIENNAVSIVFGNSIPYLLIHSQCPACYLLTKAMILSLFLRTYYMYAI